MSIPAPLRNAANRLALRNALAAVVDEMFTQNLTDHTGGLVLDERAVKIHAVIDLRDGKDIITIRIRVK